MAAQYGRDSSSLVLEVVERLITRSGLCAKWKKAWRRSTKGREISLCAGRRIRPARPPGTQKTRRSEYGRKSRPAPFEMTCGGGGPNEVGVRVLIDLPASENVQLVNKQCDRASSESSASDKEKILRSPAPPTDRLRPYQS